MVGQPFEPLAVLVHLVDLRIAVLTGRERQLLPAGRPLRGDVQTRKRDERPPGDRKSTRLNSSHLVISYAVFCLKKKKTVTALASLVVVVAAPQRAAHMNIHSTP